MKGSRCLDTTTGGRSRLQNQRGPHLVGGLGHRRWVLRLHRGFRFPVCLNNLRGTIGSAFLHDGHSLQKSWSAVGEKERKKADQSTLLDGSQNICWAEMLPHVVIFLEKCVVLHSSLLQLHVDAAAVYRNHLFDSAKRSFICYRLAKGDR